MDERGRITFGQRGLIRTYWCTCANPDPEPSEVGVWCMNCGASAAWPEETWIGVPGGAR